MMLFIIDGKQPGYSEGATLGELGVIVREHGALNAIRLDEGGSCALAVEEKPGAGAVIERSD
jgi:exopolysaccharide biosynthesis protein